MQRAWRGQEAYSEVQEGSRLPYGGLGEVGRPSLRAGRGREAHPEVWKAYKEVWERSGDPPGSQERVVRPFRRAGRGREVLQESQQRSGGAPRGPVEAGRPFCGLAGVRRPIWRSKRGREAHPEVWKAHSEARVGLAGPQGGWGGRESLPVDCEWSRGPPRRLGGVGRPTPGAGGVGRPTRWSRRGREALSMGWEVSGSPSVGSKGIGRLTQRSGKVREAHPEVQNTNTKVREGSGGPPRSSEGPLGVQEGLGGPPRGLGGVGSSMRRFGLGREACPQVREGSESPPGGWEGSGGPSGGPR